MYFKNLSQAICSYSLTFMLCMFQKEILPSVSVLNIVLFQLQMNRTPLFSIQFITIKYQYNPLCLHIFVRRKTFQRFTFSFLFYFFMKMLLFYNHIL